MKKLLFVLLLSAGTAQADVVSELQAGYASQGARAPNAAAGEAMWRKPFDTTAGERRRCASCHTENLRTAGKHARTGKPIDPMAPSANPARLTDAKKIEKWFTRNCKWTVGRACTPQEKADFLSYIQSQ
jgi:mono/diheme cytochrome c family protein